MSVSGVLDHVGWLDLLTRDKYNAGPGLKDFEFVTDLRYKQQVKQQVSLKSSERIWKFPLLFISTSVVTMRA